MTRLIVVAVLGFIVWVLLQPRTDRAADVQAFNAQDRATMTTLIQANGFNCPSVNLATARGPVPEGVSVRAYCGPPNTNGIYENLAYQVIFRDGALPIVRPGRGP